MKSIEWLGSRVRLIDQTKLPLEEITIETDDYRVVAEAITSLRIRGAPAIGIAAAYAVALAAAESASSSFDTLSRDISTACDALAATRPTAVNLFSALRRMKGVLPKATSREEARSLLVREAIAIH